MPGHPNIHTDKPVCVEMFKMGMKHTIYMSFPVFMYLRILCASFQAGFCGKVNILLVKLF